MGSGKSTVGKSLSEQLKGKFIDIDSIIENKMSMSIASIFEIKREYFFRKLEVDENKVKNASYDQDRGFGLRTVKGDAINFFHSSEISEDILNQGLKAINNNIKYGCNGKNNLKSNENLYESNNPISMFKLDKKINLLKKINHYARSFSSAVKQVSISLNGSHQNIEISKKSSAAEYMVLNWTSNQKQSFFIKTTTPGHGSAPVAPLLF